VLQNVESSKEKMNVAASPMELEFQQMLKEENVPASPMELEFQQMLKEEASGSCTQSNSSSSTSAAPSTPSESKVSTLQITNTQTFEFGPAPDSFTLGREWAFPTWLKHNNDLFKFGISVRETRGHIDETFIVIGIRAHHFSDSKRRKVDIAVINKQELKAAAASLASSTPATLNVSLQYPTNLVPLVDQAALLPNEETIAANAFDQWYTKEKALYAAAQTSLPALQSSADDITMLDSSATATNSTAVSDAQHRLNLRSGSNTEEKQERKLRREMNDFKDKLSAEQEARKQQNVRFGAEVHNIQKGQKELKETIEKLVHQLTAPSPSAVSSNAAMPHGLKRARPVDPSDSSAAHNPTKWTKLNPDKENANPLDIDVLQLVAENAKLKANLTATRAIRDQALLHASDMALDG
jgi:hypothetical protein